MKKVLEVIMDFDALELIVSITLPILGGIWGIITSTRKYELTTQLRMELLSWYTETSRIMIDVIHYISSGLFYENSFVQEKTALLSKLSAQIEIGRFYFPNVLNKNGYGNEKPLAYCGNRHAILEFVYKFYTVASKSHNVTDNKILWDLEREYTSAVFFVIDPRDRNKKHKRYTNLAIDENLHYYNYLKQRNGK